MQKRTKQPSPALVEAHLPLRPAACAAMAALAEGPKIGIDILDAVNATAPGGGLLGPGTLYRLLRELRQQGLVTHAELPDGVSDDRHSPHALTPLGSAVLDADIQRLQRTIHLATRTRRA